MNVNLQPHQEQAIQAAIKADRFHSFEEFIESTIRTLVSPETSPTGPVASSAKTEESMLKIEGLWVHQGQAEPGADWDRAVSNVRDERTVDLLKASFS